MMKDTKKTESNFAGKCQQVRTDAIIEAVQKATAAYGKYGSHRIPDYDLQDIAQDAFEKAYRSIGSYDPSKASIQTWVSTIVYNCVYDYWKDRTKREGWSNFDSSNSNDSYPIEEEDGFSGSGYKGTTPYDICSDSDPEKELLSKEMMEWIKGHIDRLPNKSRFIIEQTLKGMKPAQIATMLGCTPNTVSIILHRAIQAIKKEAEVVPYLAA